MITCEIHEFSIERRELVVTIMDDATLVLDRKNIGLPLNPGNQPDIAEIRKRVSRRVQSNRQTR